MTDTSNRCPAEQECLDLIQHTFRTAGVKIVRPQRLEVNIRADLMPPFLTYMKSHLEFDQSEI